MKHFPIWLFVFLGLNGFVAGAGEGNRQAQLQVVSEAEIEFINAFYEGQSFVQIDKPLMVRDKAGNVVGLLNPGCVLHSAGMEDYHDTDLSMGGRWAMIFDVPDGFRLDSNRVSRIVYHSQFAGCSGDDQTSNVVRYNKNRKTSETLFSASDADFLAKHWREDFSVELDSPVQLKDFDGRIVGYLNAGIVLNKGGMDDYDRTGRIPGHRLKLVVEQPVDSSAIMDEGLAPVILGTGSGSKAVYRFEAMR